jgi:hypothetical protein
MESTGPCCGLSSRRSGGRRPRPTFGSRGTPRRAHSSRPTATAPTAKWSRAPRRDNGIGDHKVRLGPFNRPEHRRNDRSDGHAASTGAVAYSVRSPCPRAYLTLRDRRSALVWRAYPPIWTAVGLWMESRWTRQMDRSGSTVGSLNAGCQPGRGGPLVADVRWPDRSTVTGGVAGNVQQEARRRVRRAAARWRTRAYSELPVAAGMISWGRNEASARRCATPRRTTGWMRRFRRRQVRRWRRWKPGGTHRPAR